MRNRALGLDLGQVQDPTALALVEWTRRPDGERVYALRHLERLPLGTGYPAIVAHLGRVLAADDPDHPGHPLEHSTQLVADATGVGRAVVDQLRDARLRPLPVVVHGGWQTSVDEWGYHHVPKRELVGVAQVLLQDRRLRLSSRLPFVAALEEELLRFEVKITDAGRDTYGAWREGQHDDLVFALCLAVWYGEDKAAARDAPLVHGKITRLTESREAKQQRAARAFWGPGKDPRADGLLVGRNGYVKAGR